MASNELKKNFTLIAHRGFSSDAPENTFDAFDLALEHGFDNMETDVQLTSGGACVLIHDDQLDRTTGGKGPVAEASIAYVKSLDAGLWFEGADDTVGRKGPAAYGDSFVPTLDDFLDRYHDRAGLHLELKSNEQELAGLVAPLLREYEWTRPDAPSGPGVTISSFNPAQLFRSKKLLPDLDHGWLLQSITAVDIELALQIGCAGIYPRAGDVTAEQVAAARTAGLTVRTWGVGNERDLRNAHASGAAGTTVDWPLRAQTLLGH